MTLFGIGQKYEFENDGELHFCIPVAEFGGKYVIDDLSVEDKFIYCSPERIKNISSEDWIRYEEYFKEYNDLKYLEEAYQKYQNPYVVISVKGNDKTLALKTLVRDLLDLQVLSDESDGIYYSKHYLKEQLTDQLKDLEPKSLISILDLHEEDYSWFHKLVNISKNDFIEAVIDKESINYNIFDPIRIYTIYKLDEDINNL